MITIRRSPIHGVGVFTVYPQLKGMVMGRLNLVNVGPASAFKKDQLPTVGFVDFSGNVQVPIDGWPLWAVNWSENPNIALTNTGRVMTLRPILAGEELTIAYYDKDNHGKSTL